MPAQSVQIQTSIPRKLSPAGFIPSVDHQPDELGRRFVSDGNNKKTVVRHSCTIHRQCSSRSGGAWQAGPRCAVDGHVDRRFIAIDAHDQLLFEHVFDGRFALGRFNTGLATFAGSGIEKSGFLVARKAKKAVTATTSATPTKIAFISAPTWSRFNMSGYSRANRSVTAPSRCCSAIFSMNAGQLIDLVAHWGKRWRVAVAAFHMISAGSTFGRPGFEIAETVMVSSPKEHFSNDQTEKNKTGPSVYDRAGSARRGPQGRDRKGLPCAWRRKLGRRGHRGRRSD
jgi:hypothetical protein